MTVLRTWALTWWIAAGVWCGVACRLDAEEPAFRDPPAVQVLPLPHAQAAFQYEGRELTRYHFDDRQQRPFLYPLIGPAGRSLTRMGHPHDPTGHSHHNSVWIAHHVVNGVSFWDDRSPGRIVPQRIEFYEDGATRARLAAHHVWMGPRRSPAAAAASANPEPVVPILNERRVLSVLPQADGEWWLVIDLELTPAAGPVEFGQTPFGLIGVRMAKPLGVHDGGGLIRNSSGGVNEPGVFWKPAKWVDYTGKITPHAVEGITLCDHPGNPRHPAQFHVRNDGWMGACVSFTGPLTVAVGETLSLRYGLYVHRGLPTPAELESRWQAFAAWPRDTAPPARPKN